MTSHASIKAAVAEAIRASEDVRAFCVEHFGRGALVIVDWFGAEGAPGEREAPYVFLYSTGENQTGQVDEETFEFSIEIGGVAAGMVGPPRTVSSARTATENGMVVNGCAAELEELRTIVVGILKSGAFGASLRSVTLSESSVITYPLEWSSIRCEFFEPDTITP